MGVDIVLFDDFLYRLAVVLVKAIGAVGFGDDELIIRQLRDLSFSRNEHFVALELKLVKVENVKVGAEHALQFVDGPGERNVDFEFSFGVDYCEVFGFFEGQVGREAGSYFVEGLH